MRPTPTSSSPGEWAGCSKASTTRAEPPPSTPCGQLPPPTRPPTASPSPRPPGSPPPGGADPRSPTSYRGVPPSSPPGGTTAGSDGEVGLGFDATLTTRGRDRL